MTAKKYVIGALAGLMLGAGAVYAGNSTNASSAKPSKAKKSAQTWEYAVGAGYALGRNGGIASADVYAGKGNNNLAGSALVSDDGDAGASAGYSYNINPGWAVDAGAGTLDGLVAANAGAGRKFDLDSVSKNLGARLSAGAYTISGNDEFESASGGYISGLIGKLFGKKKNYALNAAVTATTEGDVSGGLNFVYFFSSGKPNARKPGFYLHAPNITASALSNREQKEGPIEPPKPPLPPLPPVNPDDGDDSDDGDNGDDGNGGEQEPAYPAIPPVTDPIQPEDPTLPPVPDVTLPPAP